MVAETRALPPPIRVRTMASTAVATVEAARNNAATDRNCLPPLSFRCRRQVRTISAGGKAFGVAPPRANTKAIRWPLQYHNPLYMAAVYGHSVRQQHVGRHLCGRGGMEGHVGGPEAEKWAVGILFYILTRRLPALTL